MSTDYDRKRLQIDRDHATGLLAQAKLGVRKDDTVGKFKWNRFTTSQKNLFPDLSEFYSLLLYRLSGQNCNKLQDFAWQLCKGHSFEQLKNYLKSDTFPTEVSSSEVLRALFARKIGTENADTIEKLIDPSGPKFEAIDIHIYWPDGSGPPPSVEIIQQHHTVQHVYQRA
jgi:hypothetical protein